MVGRGGISKGCMSCRQRKKGCDMQRPACGQCLQRGSTCPGYAAGATFVHDSRSVSSDKIVPSRAQNRGLSQVSTPPSLIRSAAQAGLSDHFWYIYLPRKYTSPGAHHGSLDEFFQAVEHTSSDAMVSKHAFWALSSLTIGREVSDPQLLQQASRMYGQALRELRGAIERVRNMSSPSSAEMVMTCNLLALYEVFDDPSQTRFGFFTHSQGLLELVRLLGPNGFRSGVAWSVFQGVRVAIILSAIQSRESTFLSSKEWSTIPWNPKSKPAWQEVIDITAQVPELLEKLDQLQRNSSHRERRIRSLRLLSHCRKLDRALQAWYQELPTLFGLETSIELWHTKKNTRTDSPFATEVYFEDQVHAQALIFYWTTCVFVYSTMQKLCLVLKSTAASERDPTSSSPQHAISMRTDPYYYAAHIVQSIPYFTQPSVGLLMRKIFVVSLATAYAYFASSPSKSTASYSPGTSQAPTSNVAGLTGSFESAAINASLPGSEFGDFDVNVVQTYIEATVKAMHLYGVQLNIFCEPSSRHDSLVLKDSG